MPSAGHHAVDIVYICRNQVATIHFITILEAAEQYKIHWITIITYWITYFIIYNYYSASKRMIKNIYHKPILWTINQPYGHRSNSNIRSQLS